MKPEHLLGLWVVAGSMITLVAAVVGAVVVLPPGRWRTLHWSEQAQLAHPARIAPVVSVFAIAIVSVYAAGTLYAIFGFSPSIAQMSGTNVLACLPAILVAMFMSWFVSARPRPIGRWVMGCITALFIRFATTSFYVLLAIALIAFPRTIPNAIAILLIAAVGMGLTAWGAGVWVLRLLGLAWPALPRARNAADWAAERVSARASEVYELRWQRVSIDIFPFSRYLVVTEAAAELLSDEDLLALTIRDMTYLKQPLLVGAIRITDSLIIYFMLACTVVGTLISPHAQLIGVIVGFSSAYLVRPFVRRAKLRADALSADSSVDPTTALFALERQFELNLQPVVATSNRSSEPHLYDRLLAGGIQPLYPRPRPPSVGKIIASIAAAVVTFVVLSLALVITVGTVIRL